MSRYIDIDHRAEFVNTTAELLSSCHFKHKDGCCAPDCKTCLDRNFDFLSHLLPTVDVTPIIRCKDCKYCTTNALNPKQKLCNRVKFFAVYDDDFCSHGIRKEENRNGGIDNEN